LAVARFQAFYRLAQAAAAGNLINIQRITCNASPDQ
jgi:hypothetical protein